MGKQRNFKTAEQMNKILMVVSNIQERIVEGEPLDQAESNAMDGLGLSESEIKMVQSYFDGDKVE